MNDCTKSTATPTFSNLSDKELNNLDKALDQLICGGAKGIIAVEEAEESLDILFSCVVDMAVKNHETFHWLSIVINDINSARNHLSIAKARVRILANFVSNEQDKRQPELITPKEVQSST